MAQKGAWLVVLLACGAVVLDYNIRFVGTGKTFSRRGGRVGIRGLYKAGLAGKRSGWHVASSELPRAEEGWVDHPFFHATARFMPKGPLEYFTVAGVSFDGRQEVLKSLLPGEVVTLEHEPNNPFDSAAVAVRTLNGTQLGYVPRGLTQRFKQSSMSFGVVESVGANPEGLLGLRVSVRPDQVGLFLHIPPRGYESKVDIQSMLQPEEWVELCRQTIDRYGARCAITGVQGEGLVCEPIFVNVDLFDPNTQKLDRKKRIYKLWGLLPLSPPLARARRVYESAQDDAELESSIGLLCIANNWRWEQAVKYVEEAFSANEQLDQHETEWIIDLEWLRSQAAVTSPIEAVILPEFDVDKDLDAVEEDLPGETPKTTTHIEDLQALTVKQLKERLRGSGLKVTGRKAELVARLAQSL
ncbi:hypothetical protein AAMO2058_001489300 [Amorphochlora amoebiformis]